MIFDHKNDDNRRWNEFKSQKTRFQWISISYEFIVIASAEHDMNLNYAEIRPGSLFECATCGRGRNLNDYVLYLQSSSISLLFALLWIRIDFLRYKYSLVEYVRQHDWPRILLCFTPTSPPAQRKTNKQNNRNQIKAIRFIIFLFEYII